MSTELDACLPVDLRGQTITRVSGGLSGAGVYRVGAHVLKVAPNLRVDILRAADAGVAPRVVHVDEARHAVVTEYVEGVGRVSDPVLLGDALRRVHALPILRDAERKDPRAMLREVFNQLGEFPVPAWVRDAIHDVLVTTTSIHRT